MLDYWFGQIELNRNWFRQKFERAEAALEERYSPDDHVEVSTEALFAGILRDDRFRHEVERLTNQITNSVPSYRHGLDEIVVKSIGNLKGFAQKIVDYKPAAKNDPAIEFPQTKYASLNKKIRGAANATLELLEKQRQSEDDTADFQASKSRI